MKQFQRVFCVTIMIACIADCRNLNFDFILFYDTIFNGQSKFRTDIYVGLTHKYDQTAIFSYYYQFAIFDYCYGEL